MSDVRLAPTVSNDFWERRLKTIINCPRALLLLAQRCDDQRWMRLRIILYLRVLTSEQYLTIYVAEISECRFGGVEVAIAAVCSRRVALLICQRGAGVAE